MIEILVPLGICVVLPVLIVWLWTRYRTNETNRRTEIMLAAIEKNSEIDVEDLMKKLNANTKPHSVKARLLKKLEVSVMCLLAGSGLIGMGVYLWVNNIGGSDDPLTAIAFGGMLTSIGVAYMISYIVGKRVLEKEIAAEEDKLETK